MDKSIKILLLEHDPHDVELICRELKKSGMNFVHRVAEDKKKFEKELSDFDPDIILSDYSFPAFDGISAFHLKEKTHPDVPFIIVSGTVGEQKVVELIKLGITDYVLKDRLLLLSARIHKALKEVKEFKEKSNAAKKLEEELISSNKELKTFIYKASHDLRGPLSSIIGLTTVSQTEVHDKTALKYIQMISDSAKKLDATLISLVQSMSIKDMSITFENINFKELIQEITSQLQFHEGTSRLKITKKNTLKTEFYSSKMILHSIFQNMIQNAVKYQNYNQPESFLNINISEKNNFVEFVFEDNGIGVDEDYKEKIFSMYFRGTSGVEGSGLGLYIVKNGIEKLGGTISLESEKGKGSKFTILLPFKQP